MQLSLLEWVLCKVASGPCAITISTTTSSTEERGIIEIYRIWTCETCGKTWEKTWKPKQKDRR